MGVPGFFAWLLKTYKLPNISSQLNPNLKYDFYLDANCLFHPQCHLILDQYPTESNVEKLELLMCNQILSYISKIIDRNITVINNVYIAVDGVAPMAKINQQRKRRFKSVIDEEDKQVIYDKYHKNINNYWSSINITPGTKFMEKLHNVLLTFISEYNKIHSIKLYYSSYHEEGEGEHKILQHIKNTNNSNNIIIYGLDADLFFLSMTLDKNMYLFREDEKSDFMYVSINTIKELFNNYLLNIIGSKYNNINFNNDIIFICYLLGNDFIPHLPTLTIKNIDLLFKIYLDLFIKFNNNIIIINKNDIKINYEFFKELIRILATYELDYFHNLIENINRKKFRDSVIRTQPEYDIWKLDNLVNHIEENPYNCRTMNLEEIKYNYYKEYFNCQNSFKNYGSLINILSQNYLEGINWITLYYFQKCPNNGWQYFYNHAPFLSDIYVFLETNKSFDINIKFNNNINIFPLKQLLMVVPNKYSQLLPKKYIEMRNKELYEYYPEKIKIDYNTKDLLYQCVPLLMAVKYTDFNVVDNIKLTKEEKIRNQSFNSLFEK